MSKNTKRGRPLLPDNEKAGVTLPPMRVREDQKAAYEQAAKESPCKSLSGWLKGLADKASGISNT